MFTGVVALTMYMNAIVGIAIVSIASQIFILAAIYNGIYS